MRRFFIWCDMLMIKGKSIFRTIVSCDVGCGVIRTGTSPVPTDRIIFDDQKNKSFM
ncbi:hypothetical protein AGMMS50249_3890 [candidate division SR1 bacterium]|nr:hypothetical protein AGMMS50249_3890 [candidate division SR1 bacterium]